MNQPTMIKPVLRRHTRSTHSISNGEFAQMLEYSLPKTASTPSPPPLFLPPPIIPERCLIFDVETTGFPVKNAGMDKQPYIIQLTFIVVNIYSGDVVGGTAESTKSKEKKQYKHHEEIKCINHYVRPETSAFVIPPKITELTGITMEQCQMEGVPVVNLLVEFYREYLRCDYVVSHNIDFDSRMILIELERHYNELVRKGCLFPQNIFNPMYNSIHGIHVYCTMTEGKDITNIYMAYKEKEKPVVSPFPPPAPFIAVGGGGGDGNGNNPLTEPCATGRFLSPPPKMFKKNPKLIELYTHLYPSNPSPVNLHNALIDTMVCMDCFLKMKYTE
jgi:DNA polymerase III epsilon subunit-like protein